MKPIRNFFEKLEPSFTKGGKYEKYYAIYEVFDISDTDQKKLKTKDTFEKAIQAYFSRDFVVAEKYLARVCEVDPYDKAARLFLNRAKEYQTIELPDHWDGVEKIEIK